MNELAITAPYVERNCVITHEGKSFESGGAFVSPDYVIGYPKGNRLQDWHGQDLGSYRVTSSWRVPNGWMSGKMFSARVVVNGVEYQGRGSGEGMIWRGKRVAKRQ